MDYGPTTKSYDATSGKWNEYYTTGEMSGRLVSSVTNPTQTPTTAPGLFSSEKGAATIADAQKKAAAMAPVPAQPTNTAQKPATDTTTSKATYINPATEQSATVNSNDANAVSHLGDKGYMFAEGDYPKSATQDPQVVQAEQDLNDARAKLTSFDVSNDPALQSMLTNISSQWDSRIADMQKVNQSRNAAINTTGVRIGSRYTGGAGGMMGSIVSEEERQGIVRLGELQAQKQAALLEAKTAYETKQWTRYAKLVDIAQEKYNQTIKQVKDLNDMAIEKAKLIQKDLEDERKYQYESVTKPINEVLTSAAENGAPPAVQAAIQAAKTPMDAMKAAGEYLTKGTGTVGEYLYYKRQAEAQGIKPLDFNAYATMDANRKAKAAAAANANGLPPQIISKVLQVAGGFDNEQVVKNYQTMAEGKAFMSNIPNDTQNPADQQGIIYAFAKIMDPNSVVREGEYNTVQKYAQSWAETYGFNAKRVFSNSPFLTPKAIDNMKKTVASRVAASEQAYKKTYADYGRRIDKITGQKDGLDYITDYSKGYEATTGGQLIKNEDDAKQKVIQLGNTNPKLRDPIKKMVADKKSYTEIMQLLGYQN